MLLGSLSAWAGAEATVLTADSESEVIATFLSYPP
jgi:hypothetical protein